MKLHERIRRFGVDTPLGFAILVFFTIYNLVNAAIYPYLLSIIFAVVLVIFSLQYFYATTTGKYHLWEKLGVQLPPTGTFLDVGCGRGMVLYELGDSYPERSLTGVDIWNKGDQLANSQTNTQKNLYPHTHIHATLFNADARSLPFDDGSFDVITSSLVIHNIRRKSWFLGDLKAKEQAIIEMIRVLKPGGKLVIADINFFFPHPYLILARKYLKNPQLKSAGITMQWGGFMRTYVLTGTK